MKPLKLTHPDPTEDQLHEAVRKLLDVALPSNACWFTVEHRNARDATEGAKRKARGVRAGVPDILICYGRVLHTIELKARTGSLSPAQIAMRSELIGAGAYWSLCRSTDDVLKVLRDWGIPISARIAA